MNDDTYMIQNKHHIEMFNNCVLDQGYKTKAILALTAVVLLIWYITTLF